MKVYQVWDWDWMDGSMGAPYLAKTFSTRSKAMAYAHVLNFNARTQWMKTCSPAGRANYRDQAYVKEVEVE